MAWRVLVIAAAGLVAGCSAGPATGLSDGDSDLIAPSAVGAAGRPESSAQRGEAETPTPALAAQHHPTIADLPVPVGFRMVEAVSRSYDSAGLRFVDYTYQGRAAWPEVDRFYRRRMPLEGWKLAWARVLRGTATLNFEKPGELCQIAITGDPRSLALTGPEATVAITVQPSRR